MDYPELLTDRSQLSTGIVIELSPTCNPGSDQDTEYLGTLPYPFAPPAYSLTYPDVNDMVLIFGHIARVVSKDGKEVVIEFLSDLGYSIKTERVPVSDITLI